jgi:hypothetical protein
MSVEQLRIHAEHCLKRAADTADELQRLRYLRAAKAWQGLADRKRQLDAALIGDAAEGQHHTLSAARA